MYLLLVSRDCSCGRATTVRISERFGRLSRNSLDLVEPWHPSSSKGSSFHDWISMCMISS